MCALVTKYYNRWILRIASVVGGSLCSLSITLRPCQGGGGNYSTFINSEALSHFNLLKKEQMFLVQQLLH